MGHTDPALPTFKGGTHGWDGTQWRKLALLWGLSAKWEDNARQTKDGDGNYLRDITAVAAGYVYVLQLAVLGNETAQRGDAYIALNDGTQAYIAEYATTPMQYEPVVLRGPVVLQVGDSIRFFQWSCVDNDVVSTSIWGYKMAIAE